MTGPGQLRTAESAGDIAARRLATCAGSIARQFERTATTWPLPADRKGRRRVWHTPALAGVVEPLLRRLGEELARPAPDPAVPWAACKGLLRLAPDRGIRALEDEVALLRELVRDVLPREAAVRGASDRALEIVRRGALAELSKLQGACSGPVPRFGGVVLVTFASGLR
jgi:hypothetical protein